MNILVTGTAGFIGFHVTKKLEELGMQVVGLDNLNNYYDVNLKLARLKALGFEQQNFDYGSINTKNNALSFIKCDLTDYESLNNLFSEFSFDAVIHLAAQAGVRYSIESPFSYVQSNLVGFSNILELCRHHKIKHLIYASSSSVYGDSKEIPFNEEQKTDAPISLYAATKKSNEVMAFAYSHLYGFKASGLRFFTVYGPWGRPDMAPILFAEAIQKGETIKVFNNGEMQRDFTFINDIVEGILGVLNMPNENLKHEVFNIGNSKPIDLMDFIREMEKQMGKKAVLKMMPMQPGDVKMTFADTKKLADCIEYRPNTSLEDGLRTFVTWFKNYNQLV
ncbi:NAD-dependent epimerase/dehydratase family protein [Croceivirga thetidis]|uniref:NAD-dependent epimerase/dehydratase family protein n=1 Tax=Croceivirga thetidis TaxID=2721623 RepID=A0ABX1GNR0_9FLAO|nr:NAD-dependent epimerase/dehydratase family protein [Croceivirga thetidis]NKI31204.1 NAD-dependent epimerase/dehydratase family protein [Croceivirga thetidis]